MIKILCIGDTYGEPGRRAIKAFVPAMKATGEVDFVVCNAENSANGSGVTESICKELFSYGCDVITGGDHFFDQKRDIENFAKTEKRLLRPANFAEELPGQGTALIECKNTKIGVLHVAGQVFMRYHFFPSFPTAEREVTRLKEAGAKIIIVDMHAEATSEKMAISWFLDGRVTAVVGTHTHVQTADERVTQKGTACLTDLGMTGPYDSVIGANKDLIMPRFLLQVAGKKEVATGDVRLCGAIISVDETTGKAVGIERIQKKLPS